MHISGGCLCTINGEASIGKQQPRSPNRCPPLDPTPTSIHRATYRRWPPDCTPYPVPTRYTLHPLLVTFPPPILPPSHCCLPAPQVATKLYSLPLFRPAWAPLAEALLAMLLSRLYTAAQDDLSDSLFALAAANWTDFLLVRAGGVSW